MVYFDNAATTLWKPKSVHRAVISSMKTAASAGRSGHSPAMRGGEILFDCRCEIANFFNIAEFNRVIFTLNATHALNIAINSLCATDQTVAISGYEHNSVTRPLHARNIPFKVIKSTLFDEFSMISQIKNLLEDGIRFFIINHVSNVFGQIAPIYEIDEILGNYNAKMIVDASQSAGVIDIDAKKLPNTQVICIAGHKSLYGPLGTGILIVNCDDMHNTLIQGGTGSSSYDINQPDFLPDKFESGTMNVHGIAGLLQGVTFIKETTTQKILSHEQMLVKILSGSLRQISGCKVFVSSNKELQTGVLSIVQQDKSCEDIAQKLADKNICVRAGLHCAPLAHKSASTLDTGTIRLSLGYSNTLSEVKHFLNVYEKIVL